MDGSLTLAYRGLKTAIDQQAMVAQRISNLHSQQNNVDLTKESVNQIQNKHSFSLNVSMAKTGNSMIGNIIDMVG